MKKERTAFILNILAFIAGMTGMTLRLIRGADDFFIYYTQLSNVVSALSSAIYTIVYIKKEKPGIKLTMLRYLAACMMFFTFIVVMCIFVPFGGNVETLVILPHGLCQHIIAPVLSVVSFAFFEQKPQKRSSLLLPTGVTLIYACIMYALNFMLLVEGPYPFFEVYSYSAPRLIVWFIELVLIDAAIGIALTPRNWIRKKKE